MRINICKIDFGKAVMIGYLLFSNTGCCRAGETDDIYKAESIVVGQYDTSEEFEPKVSDCVKGEYHMIDALKGPPQRSREWLLVKQPVKRKSDGKMDSESLPSKGTKWIIFLRYSIPTSNNRTFEVCDGASQIEYSSEALGRVLNGIEHRSNQRFSAPVRRLLCSKIDHYVPGTKQLPPILYYARGELVLPKLDSKEDSF
jgi:hypothetical protein